MGEKEGALGSDLKKVDRHRITAEEYEEIPELTDEWFDKAEFAIGDRVIRPARRDSMADNGPVVLEIDRDILRKFQAGGPDWQARINKVLREHLEKAKG